MVPRREAADKTQLAFQARVSPALTDPACYMYDHRSPALVSFSTCLVY